MILPDPDLRYWPDQPHHLTAFVGHISLLYQLPFGADPLLDQLMQPEQL